MILTQKPRITRLGVSIVFGLALSGCLSGGDNSASALTGNDPTPPVGTPNNAPTITGSPPGQAVVGENYVFQPTATDSDNDPLTFTAANLPDWLSLNDADGTIEGLPMLGDLGMNRDVTITVSDGEDSSALGPFTIEVVNAPGTPPPPPPPPPPGNNAPTISGTPPPEAIVGQEYVFQPTASDADNDTLTFTAENLPAWATLATDGTVRGTPAAGNVGVFRDITITVSDGAASASLGPFDVEVVAQGASTGSVTLSWIAPTENEDGSALTDLTGFRIYWGTEPGVYPNLEDPMNTGLTTAAGTTTYVVEDLALGTYYFVATAVDSEGTESTFSAPATTVVQ